MLCHDKKRQRLKEYINYKLNKYYTVIFTLIIWDFFVFLFFFYSSYVVPNTDHFTSHCPPATDGSFSQASEHQITQPNCVLCTQKEKQKAVKTVLLMYENDLKNQAGDVKPEEAATCKRIRETLHGSELPLPAKPTTLKHLDTWNGH